jgi:bla regulator protein blaR1
VFPRVCGVYSMEMTASHNMLAGSRNTTMDLLAAFLPSRGNLGRPVVDETGLSGRFDFTLEWAPELNSSPDGEMKVMKKGGGSAPNAGGPAGDNQVSASSDAQGPTLLEALREQLGLKLAPTTGSIQTLVIDHVERPSQN